MTEGIGATPLHDRANALVSQLQERRKLTDLANQIEGFETQLAVVAAAQHRARILSNLSAVFTKRGVSQEVTLAEANAAVAPLRQLRVEFETNPTSILGARRLSAISISVKNALDAYSERLLNAWGTYARSLIPPVNDEVLAVLEQIGDLQKTATRVRAGIRRLGDSAARLPSSEEEIVEFVSDAQKVAGAWDSLDTDHLSPEVLQFIRDAGSPTGAHLAGLTTSVTGWLASKNLTDSFRVRAVVPTNTRTS